MPTVAVDLSGRRPASCVDRCFRHPASYVDRSIRHPASWRLIESVSEVVAVGSKPLLLGPLRAVECAAVWPRIRYLLALVALCAIATCPAAKRSCTARNDSRVAEELLDAIGERV